MWADGRRQRREGCCRWRRSAAYMVWRAGDIGGWSLAVRNVGVQAGGGPGGWRRPGGPGGLGGIGVYWARRFWSWRHLVDRIVRIQGIGAENQNFLTITKTIHIRVDI